MKKSNSIENFLVPKTEKKKIFIIILSVAAVLAVIGAAVLCMAMLHDYDADIGHFRYGSAYATSSWIIGVIGTILAVYACIVCGKSVSFSHGRKRKFSFAETFLSMLAACFSVLYGTLSLGEAIPEGRNIFFILRSVFAFISAIYFLILAIGLPSNIPSTGFAASLASIECAFMLLLVYFTYDTYAMNSPLKTYELMMLVSFMLFYAAEAGCSAGRPGTEKKFAFAAVFAVTVGGQVSIARFICAVAQNDGLDFSLVSCAFRVVLWLHILATFIERVKCMKMREGIKPCFEDNKSSIDVMDDEETDPEDNEESDNVIDI